MIASVRRYRLGGLLLVLAALYFVGEAWAMAGWQGRPYDWTIDAISELGVPEVRELHGELYGSTRHVAMNATFIGSGIRVLLAGLVLAPFVPRRGRRTVLALVVAYGIGMVLIGFFPAGTAPVRGAVHGVGAVLAIAGGSAVLVASTVSFARRYPTMAVLTGLLAAVSVTGSICGVLGIGGFGLVERIAVDSVVVWQVVVGIVVLITSPGPAVDPAGQRAVEPGSRPV